MKRRELLAAAAPALALSSVASAATPKAGQRQALDLTKPEDSLRALVKLRGDLAGGRVLQTYTGTLSLLVPGRQAAPVARYQGIIRTDWTPQPDGRFLYRTFDLGYFGDLATGRAVETLTNPLTGATLQPQDVRDGPISSIYSRHGTFRDGAPLDTSKTLSIDWRRAGDHLWYGADLAFENVNPLPPEQYPELSNSATLFQRSTFTYKGRLSELEDAATSRGTMETILLVQSTVHPWLKMGRIPAVQVIHTLSHKIDRAEQAPREVLDYLERVMPEFLTADVPFRSNGGSFERYKRERLT